MKVFGLSGGIACGKSAVCTILAEQGIAIIDCDIIARKVAEKENWGWRRTRAAFKGQDVFLIDGSLDRKKLSRLIFADASARKRLNAATHLPIMVEIARQVLTSWLYCRSMVVVDMPLLFETGAWKFMSSTVVVSCSSTVQKERLVERDQIEADAAQSKIDSQLPLERKIELADHVIDNNGSFKELSGTVTSLSKTLRQSAIWHGRLLSPVSVAPLLLLGLWALW